MPPASLSKSSEDENQLSGAVTMFLIVPRNEDERAMGGCWAPYDGDNALIVVRSGSSKKCDTR